MRHTKRATGVLLALALLTLSGCASLGRESTVLESYVLGGAPGAEAAAVRADADLDRLTLGVRRLDLAPYLASPAIVVRHGDHRIVTSEFHRWAEPAGEGISRALASYLRAAAPVRAVDVAPWTARSEHDYLIQVHVSRFEGLIPGAPPATEGEARVTAAWEILRGEDGALLARGATDFRESGWRAGDYAGLVTLLDRGLSAVARDLVACVDSLASAASGEEMDAGTRSSGPAVACPSAAS